jgi:hypothetical protein
MKRNRRAVVSAPKKFSREFERNVKQYGCYKAEGITIYAPSASKSNYVLKVTFRGQSKFLSGGKTTDEAYTAFLEFKKWMLTLQNSSWGLPALCHVPLAEALEEYITTGGLAQRWKERTQRDRTRDFAGLKKMAESRNLLCSDLTNLEVRDWIRSSAGTANRGKFLIQLTATFLEWGRRSGYFTAEQMEIPKLVSWQPPKGVHYRQTLSRREQSQLFQGGQESLNGQIPTHAQVAQLADEVQKHYAYGSGLIHVSANLGTRANETFLFTAALEVGRSGHGNYVDLENMYVIVNRQVDDTLKGTSKNTKNNKSRKVVIPPVHMIANGFNLQEWLRMRSKQALEEQAQGTNPLALLFPNSKGNTLSLNNFSKRVLRPAFLELDWRMDSYTTAHGKTRALNRFTLHALRARYGTTAADEWKYTERQLLEQGSWADAATVRRFYAGTSDDTFASVQKLHGESA